MTDQKKSKDKLKFAALMMFIVVIVGVSFYFDLDQYASPEKIREFINSMGIWGPLVYMIAYGFTSIILFPASVLSTSSGMIWGPYLGTFYTVIGATISATIPFLIARYFGRGFAERMMKGTKMNICDKLISKNGFISVLVMRLIPVFPWDAVNYGSGICGIRLRDYILATFIGTIPGSFTYNLIGSSLGEPIDYGKVTLIFVMVVIMGGAAFFYKRFGRKEGNDEG